MRRFGAEVTIVESASRILNADDADAAAVITKQLETEGIVLRTSAKLLRFERDGDLRITVLERDEWLIEFAMALISSQRPRRHVPKVLAGADTGGASTPVVGAGASSGSQLLPGPPPPMAGATATGARGGGLAGVAAAGEAAAEAALGADAATLGTPDDEPRRRTRPIEPARCLVSDRNGAAGCAASASTWRWRPCWSGARAPRSTG